MTDLISIIAIGHVDPSLEENLRLPATAAHVADGFDLTVLGSDTEVMRALATRHAHVIFTFGEIDEYPSLLAAPLDVRRRWVHLTDPLTPPSQLALQALAVFVDVATADRFPDQPLVSVFTPTYRTGERILRPYRSLCDQSYPNWEWVVYDDSPEGDRTFSILSELASADPRVKVFRSNRNCGRIGEVKRRCCGLARGSILVELDHDDELVGSCLSDVLEAFAAFPDAGFAYTDCAEVFENGVNGSYGETYAFGFGSYRVERYRGRDFFVTNYPSINAKTVRHIVGMPNHVRAWRREAYERAGGYNSEVHVADDFELCIRTFLTTRMIHVQRFGYIQYLGEQGENTQRRRNAEIQRLVGLFADRFNQQIHERFAELGFADYIWTDEGLDWTLQPPPTGFEANYVYR